MSSIRIGTRGSALAVAQANWVKGKIIEHRSELDVQLCVIKTAGDRSSDTLPGELGGKGIFTKEIEEALLRGEVDLAVHSMKDLPPRLSDGLVIAATPPREDPRDVLVCRSDGTIRSLEPGSKVGTGSLRRAAQILHTRADLLVVPIRGNVDTRLRKLDAGEVDALVLAAAGLKRIGRAERIAEYLSDDICVSAAAQGCLGIETREDSSIRGLLSFLHDEATSREVAAERALLDRLGGSCRVPIGARARIENGRLHLIGIVASPDGRRICRKELAGEAGAAAALGKRVAEAFLEQGAGELLR